MPLVSGASVTILNICASNFYKCSTSPAWLTLSFGRKSALNNETFYC